MSFENTFCVTMIALPGPLSMHRRKAQKWSMSPLLIVFLTAAQSLQAGPPAIHKVTGDSGCRKSPPARSFPPGRIAGLLETAAPPSPALDSAGQSVYNNGVGYMGKALPCASLAVLRIYSPWLSPAFSQHRFMLTKTLWRLYGYIQLTCSKGLSMSIRFFCVGKST